MIAPVFKRFPFLEFLTLLIALLSIAIWHIDLDILNNYPGELLMSRAGAVTFIICIAAKICFEYSDRNSILINASRVLAGLVIGIGLLRIAAVVFNINSIESFFFYQNNIVNTSGTVNSMAVITAFTFVIVGLSVYLLTLRNERIFFPQILSLITLFVAFLFGIAFVFNNNTFPDTSIYKPMGTATALSFALLALSVLRVNKQQGIIADITGNYQGGKIARLLLPMAIAIPIILSFFRLKSEESGLYDQPYGIALFTVARITILILFIWRIAVIINRSNKIILNEIEERKKTEAALQYRKALLEAQNEAIPDGVLIVNNEGKIISYNHRIAEIWGIPENVLRKDNDETARELAKIQLKDPKSFIDRVNYIYAHPEENSHDEIEFADGRIVERFGNAVVGEDGTRYGWAWYFRDITTQKHSEQTIKNFNKELEEKVDERTAEVVKSEKRFRSVIENANDIISLSDESGKRIYVSPAIERITGFTVEETINRSIFDIVHPEDIEQSKKLRDELTAEPGVNKRVSFRFLHKNGGFVWIEGTIVNLLHDTDVHAMVGNFHDVTERKKAEEVISKSEKRFRSLIENSNDLISLSDGNGNLFYVSPSVEKITGHSIAETINRSVFNFVHPDDIKGGELARQQFLKYPGKSIPISFRYFHKNGHYIWMEGTLVNLLNDENVKAVVGNYHDVTETKISAEKIRLSNERFEMVSKATNDAVWDWNLETDDIYWNEEIKLMFNYSRNDIPTGSAWKTHIHTEDASRVIKKIEYHINNKIQNWQDEYRFLCADGSYKHVFDRGFILLNNESKPFRMIGAMQDITELHQLQQKLNDEKINKQKELIKSSIEGQEKERAEIGRELHDNINQLLTATKLYLDVAGTQPHMKDDMIKRSQQNLSNCMDEIRKLSSTLVAPSVTAHSFSAIIKDLIEPIKMVTALNIQHEVNKVDSDTLTPIQLLNIYRIIQEHLNNILKHAGATNVFISLQQKDASINLNIRDDGQGFDMAAKRNGIGFKNIQSRTELLEGHMEILSKPGEGCLLKINFPVKSIVA